MLYLARNCQCRRLLKRRPALTIGRQASRTHQFPVVDRRRRSGYAQARDGSSCRTLAEVLDVGRRVIGVLELVIAVPLALLRAHQARR